MSIINQRILPGSENPLIILWGQLALARAEAEEVGWFRWQSDSFTNTGAYKKNYRRCMQLKLRTERLIEIALQLKNGHQPASERRERFVAATVVVPPPRELDLRSLENRERALALIAEKARARVHRLGLLIQDLLTADQLRRCEEAARQ